MELGGRNSNSVQYSLTQNSIRQRIFIYPLNTLVANPTLEIFGVYDIHHTIGDTRVVRKLQFLNNILRKTALFKALP